MCKGHERCGIDSRNHQCRSGMADGAVLAIIGIRRFVSLFRLMARCQRLARHRLLFHVLERGLALIRKHAAQHRGRRKGLYWQDQHHQDQQESVCSGTHWVSVIKKTGPSK